jgi:hypothetical protein
VLLGNKLELFAEDKMPDLNAFTTEAAMSGLEQLSLWYNRIRRLLLIKERMAKLTKKAKRGLPKMD